MYSIDCVRDCQDPTLICMWIPVGSNYSDVIMSTMASQITSPTIVYSAVYSGADQRKHQSSASLAFNAANSENFSIRWRVLEEDQTAACLPCWIFYCQSKISNDLGMIECIAFCNLKDTVLWPRIFMHCRCDERRDQHFFDEIDPIKKEFWYSSEIYKLEHPILQPIYRALINSEMLLDLISWCQ